MSWLLDGQPLRSILVTRLRYLGDVVMSTVVLEALKAGAPQLRLGFLCEEEHGVVLENHPRLDSLHLLRTKRRGSDALARHNSPNSSTDFARDLPPASTLAMVRQLRAQHYDLAVDLFFNPRSAWLLRLAGIPARIGGTRGSRRHLYSHTVIRQDLGAQLNSFQKVAPGGLGEHLLRLAPLVHEPSGLDFLAWFESYRNGLPMRPTLEAPKLGPRAQAALTSVTVEPERPFVLLAPGATWPSKEWPLASWQKLVQKLAKENEANILVVSPPGAHQDWASLSQDIPPGRGGVLPVLDLKEVMGLLGSAQLVVSVDGGLMHMSVGLGTPTVGIFGPTRPDIWFPYEGSGPFRVLCTRPACHPCNLHQCDEFICLPQLEPDAVLQAASALAGKRGTL